MTGPGQRTGEARLIWLHICREGGKWTPDEIALVVGRNRAAIARMMHTMATRARQLKHYKERGRASFGVTSDCAIPFGITVKDLAEAGVLEAE